MKSVDPTAGGPGVQCGGSPLTPVRGGWCWSAAIPARVEADRRPLAVLRVGLRWSAERAVEGQATARRRVGDPEQDGPVL